MECYCVARNKPIRHEITKPQTAAVISLWFWEVCLRILNFIVIGQYTQSTLLKFFRCSRFSEFHSELYPIQKQRQKFDLGIPI